MARGSRVGVKGSNPRIQHREQDSEESDEEYNVAEDEECNESDEYCSLDGDESEETLADFQESRGIARSRNTRRTSGKKGNEIKKPRKKRRVFYTNDDDDDDVDVHHDDDEEEEEEFDDDDEEEEFDDDEDDAEFMSLGRKACQISKSREKKRVSYREVDDEEEDYSEFFRDSYTEEDEEDAEFMYLARNVNQKKSLREKRKVSYTEDDDEDNDEFMSSSRKGSQIKRPREKRMVSYKEDIEEEEDEKDAEFMLSESDFVDDEDESPKMKRNEKVSRCHPQKKSVGGGRRKSRNSKMLKKPTMPKQRNRRFSSKLGSTKGRPVTKTNQVKKQSKKISRRGKQRVMAESDSDFVSSAASDHEYTISEEEREQMREARVYCANLRAKLRNSSCGKQEEGPVCEKRKHPVRKDKEKVEDMKDEVGKQVCGICLSEEGKRTVRGVLNCCRHYFCFSCIMEWSKVESRCPLCKQRFATITKAAKSETGFDLRTVVIPVPECDQVYQPSEEELRDYLDPYETVICTECHHGGEDALMLLCDICDSSAHTFCVGLGREVPEGNWYCEGCRPTVFGSLNSQRPTPTPDRRSSSNTSDLSSPIAGGFDLNELYVPETPLAQQTRVLPEPRLPVGDFMPAPAVTIATTLRDRRRIHRQMHHRFLNNNRMSDLVARSGGISASSSGIRLFGSQLNQARDSTPQQTITSQTAAHPHASFDGREDHVMPSIRDASPSPYACREVIGPSRTSQGGLRTPY